VVWSAYCGNCGPLRNELIIAIAKLAIHNFVTGCGYALERKRNTGK
jgi:hypothetical protein